jgi:prolyl oligopeptidase
MSQYHTIFQTVFEPSLMTPADDISLPPTRREVITDNLHGTEIPDPYRWLENDTEEVQEWTETQNEYTNAYLDTPTHNKLRPVMQELAEVTEYGTIKVRNNRHFQTVESPEDDHPRLLVRESHDDKGVVLVDPNEWQANNDEDTPTRSMSWFLPAYDGEHVAYGVTEGGDEQNDIHVVTVPDSEEVALEDCGRVSLGLISFDAVSPGMVAWDGDSEGLYYVATGSAEAGTQMEKELRRWRFDGSEETLLEHDDTVWPTVRTDPESGILAVGLLEMGVGIDWHVQIDGELRPVITDNDSETFVMFHDGTVFLQTDHEAPHKRVLSCSLARFCEGCEFAECKTVLPEREAILQSFVVTSDHLVAHYQKNAHSQLSVYSHDGEHVRDLPLPDYASVSQLRSNVDAEEVFYQMESFDQPPIIVQADPASGEQRELARIDSERQIPNDLVVHQEFVESSDDAEVPVFICHHANIELDGDNPTVLYGYGGFRKSQTPSFDRFRLPFLADGGVYAQVCTRGGQEYGEEWHEEGMLAKKQHTFDDFIAAGEYLCTADYTNPDRLAVTGRSNGGLSVGAVVTQRPDLWAAARCAVPLLDMLRFYRFLLGESWTTEYGHPENPTDFEYIREYSPYHNVESGTSYPSILFTTAVEDSRVHPSHARKMTARMQNETDGGPFLLRTKTDTGHGSGKPTSMIVTEKTDEWTFLYDQLGMSE